MMFSDEWRNIGWRLAADGSTEAGAAEERSRWRWENCTERATLTWGEILDGAPLVAAVRRHQILAGARLLEIGPGYGRFLRALTAEEYGGYVGLDINVQRVGELRREFPAAQFVTGDVESWPGADGSRDCVVSFLTFKHLYPDLSRAARNCRRLLSPGGALIFDTPESAKPASGGFERDTDCFVRGYTRGELRALLAAAGFSRVEFDLVLHKPGFERLLVIARTSPGRDAHG